MWRSPRRAGIAAVMAVLAGSGLAVAGGSGKSGTSDVALARDYVFAACIIDRYSGTPLAAEAEGWASGLIEAGKIPGEAYADLAEIAKSAPEPLQSSSGTKMQLQSCTRLYHDPAVLKRIKAIVSRRK